MQFVIVIGLLQIGAAFGNVAKLLQFVSRPVVLGYFGGITFAIIVTQLFGFTGVESPVGDQPMVFKAGYWVLHLMQIKWATLLIGFFSLISLLSLRRILKNWPNALIMLVGASFLAALLNQWLGGENVAVLGDFQLPSEPLPQFDFPLFDFKLISKIFPAAVAIAFLAIL